MPKTYAELTPEDWPEGTASNAGVDICVVCGDTFDIEEMTLCETCSHFACEEHISDEDLQCTDCKGS